MFRVSKMEKKAFKELCESVRQMKAIEAGKMKPGRVFKFDMNVRGIRQKMGVSQGDFAVLIGVSVDTIQNWEQARTKPSGPARALLRVLKHNPESVVTSMEAEKQVALS